MGEEMRSLAIAYDLVLVSPARRAVETWEILKSEWRSGFAVREEAQLYGASAEQLADLVAETEDVVNRLLLVGHNPGLHHLAFDLTQGDTSVPHEQLAAKFPTGALAKIELPIASWADFHGSRGRLARFLRPRDFN